MPELNCKIDGCDYAGNVQGLRSHLHGRKDDRHVEAAENRDHHDWYPAAYGLDDTDADEEGDETPAETPTEGGSEEGTDDDPDETPTEEGSKSPDSEADEYAEQWESATPSEGGQDEGTDDAPEATPDDDPEEGSEDGGNGGLGKALVLGTGLLAVGVLLRGGGQDTPESPDADTDDDTHQEDAAEGSGWGQDEGADPFDSADSNDMEFTRTET